MSVVIHHNPACSKSRKTLEIILNAGVDPVVVCYLDEGWTRPQLVALFAAAGLTPRQALHLNNAPAKQLGLADPGIPDETVLEAMLSHPVLVNRPIVCTPKGVKLCRPPESVLELLDV